MLNGALELSKLVQEQEVVSWGEERSVEKYVETLKTVVEKLSKQNNMLTNYHNQAMEKIFSLREVDLIKEYSKWKDVAKQVRNILNQVEAKGFKNLQTWKKFLDKELALVLEKQYINSLDSLHLYLPEIYVDLTYRNLNLGYSPPEDQLKKVYEQQLKRFLDTPLSFRGISDDDTVFKEITER
nr:unnamed protein product [Callosobruchus analis]